MIKIQCYNTALKQQVHFRCKDKSRIIKKASDFSEAFVVRVKGLEPSHREAPDPKSGVSTNFTTPAG